MAQKVKGRVGQPLSPSGGKQSSLGGGAGLPSLGIIPQFLAGLFANVFGQQGQQPTPTAQPPQGRAQPTRQLPIGPRPAPARQPGAAPTAPAAPARPTVVQGQQGEVVTFTPIGVSDMTLSALPESPLGQAMLAVQQTIGDLTAGGASPAALGNLGNLGEFFGIPAGSNASVSNAAVVQAFQQATADALGDPVVGQQIFMARLRQFLAGDEQVPLGDVEPAPDDPFLAALIDAFGGLDFGAPTAAPGTPEEEGQDAAFFLDPAFTRGTETFDFFPGA